MAMMKAPSLTVATIAMNLTTSRTYKMATNCKGCGAEIEWSKTEAGKAVPLNRPPEKRFIMLMHHGEGEYVKLVETWVSHFATCPKASEFRNKR
jgi:hypothetical protein